MVFSREAKTEANSCGDREMKFAITTLNHHFFFFIFFIEFVFLVCDGQKQYTTDHCIQEGGMKVSLL